MVAQLASPRRAPAAAETNSHFIDNSPNGQA